MRGSLWLRIPWLSIPALGSTAKYTWTELEHTGLGVAARSLGSHIHQTLWRAGLLRGVCGRTPTPPALPVPLAPYLDPWLLSPVLEDIGAQ